VRMHNVVMLGNVSFQRRPEADVRHSKPGFPNLSDLISFVRLHHHLHVQFVRVRLFAAGPIASARFHRDRLLMIVRLLTIVLNTFKAIGITNPSGFALSRFGLSRQSVSFDVFGENCSPSLCSS
jgi:hypothetical protein